MELTMQEYDALRAEKTRADTLYQILYYTIARFGIAFTGGNEVATIQVIPIQIDAGNTIRTDDAANSTLLVSIVKQDSSTLTNNENITKEKSREDTINSATKPDQSSEETVGENGEGEGAGLVSSPSLPLLIDEREDEEAKKALEEVME